MSLGWLLTLRAPSMSGFTLPRRLIWLVGLLGLFLSSVSEAQSVNVEYRVLSENTTGEVITKSIEVHVLNVGPDTMLGTSATISAFTTMPIDPLGQMLVGDVPVGAVVATTGQISFSVANEPAVRFSPGLLFTLTFYDAGGRQGVISALGTRIP